MYPAALFTACVLLVVVLCAFLLYYLYYIPQQFPKKSRNDLITCVMITANREKLARAAIDNFREQTHRRKHLLIINHGAGPSLADPERMYNVTELRIDKGAMTLGDMRNMAFELVPYNGLFCVWDDDDYRAPAFLETLYSAMIGTGADGVCFQNRLEYNIKTNFAWRTFLRKGFVHVLARKDYRVRYLSKDSMEDVELLDTMRRTYRVHTLIDNDPCMYVRLVHGTNTSEYVDAGKTTVVRNPPDADWQEHLLTAAEAAYIRDIYVPLLTQTLRPSESL